MAAWAKQTGSAFVVATGDNVYEKGIKSASDPIFSKTVTNIYKALQTPFYAVLGNHDWAGSGKAQGDGAALGMPRWHGDMWNKDGQAGVVSAGNGLLDIFFIDTQSWATDNTAAFVRDGLAPAAIGTDKAAAKKFWANWRDAQVARLEAQMSQSSARWKIVAGHHGIYSYATDHGSTPSLARLNEVLRRLGAQAYVNGHDHDLMAIQLPASDPNGPLYITSGAGSSTRNDVKDPSHDGSLIYSYGFSGFTAIALTQDEMTVTFVDMKGNALKTLTKAWVAAPDCTASADSRCSAPVAPAMAAKSASDIMRTIAYGVAESLGY
jgi:tartrate-resistant acid phosphatase type 5